MERRNYYRILGIDRSASGAEIKAAYRRLAKRFHPDVTDDPEGESKFKAMAEAYRMLKGRETRRAYDRRNLHVHGGSDCFAPNNPLELWCALFLWSPWSLIWLR
ncbi:MAG: DnaJ domain-containing protein [Pseudomonadota bacterium]